MLESVIIPLIYLASAVSFILGLKQLSHPRTAPKGNSTAAVGMLLAIIGTLFKTEVIDFQFIIIGLVVGSAIGVFAAKRVEMTSMPQLVALFNGFGGLSSLLVATSEVYSGNQLGTFTLSTVSLSILIGSITFSGSLVAFAKLQGIMRGMPLVFKGARIFNGLLILLVILLTVYTVMNPSELFTYILWIIALSLIS